MDLKHLLFFISFFKFIFYIIYNFFIYFLLQLGSVPNPEIPTEWIDLRGDCLTAMRNQIQKEIDASYQYLAMGAHFSRDTVNRPGFAELFFKAAKEEREHGSKLIEYLTMRGQLTDRVTDLITIPVSRHFF